MRRVFVLVCTVLSLFSVNAVMAAEPPTEETKSLQEVIQAQTDPSFYEYLQSEIDRSFLPGYQVAGKTILECYYGYDFQAPDKTLEACLQRIDSAYKYYIIIDENKCYVLEKLGESTLQYIYDSYDRWEQLCTMLSETDATTEICGAIRTITDITCFRSYGDSLVVYIQTMEGIFVRHYGRWYEGEASRGEEGNSIYTARDYTWEEFIKYTNGLTEWWKTDNGYHNLWPCLSQYIWALDHLRTPIHAPARSTPVYIWIAIVGVGVVLVAGTVVAIAWRIRRKKS